MYVRGDFHSIDRVGVGIGLEMADLIQCGEAGDHFTKDCVLAVLGRDGLETDIKLTSIRLAIRIDFVR